MKIYRGYARIPLVYGRFASIKLSFDKPLKEFLPAQIAKNSMRLLDISIYHTLRTADLPFYHRDPFDRMIIAQSLSENLPVLSDDNAFDAYGIERVW